MAGLTGSVEHVPKRRGYVLDGADPGTLERKDGKMSQIHLRSRRRKIVAMLALLGVLAAIVGGAAAYFIGHADTGTSANRGNATLPSVAACGTVNVAGGCWVNVIDNFATASLYPGSSTLVNFTVENFGGAGSVNRTFSLSSPVVTVTSPNAACQTVLTNIPGSFTTSGFTWTQIQNYPAATPTTISGVAAQTLSSAIAGQESWVKGTFNLNFVDSGDQSNCAGQQIDVALSL